MELPADVWYEILVNLPVRTLKKFQCVCKSWCSLISDPFFQKDYNNRRLQQDPLLLLVREKGDDRASGTNTLTFSTYNISEGSLVQDFSRAVSDNFSRAVSLSDVHIESCQGLLCAYDERQILLCNPSTREIITLPPTDGNTEFIGLGFAAFTKEFKVVRFFWSYDWSNYEKDFCCEVFTLGSSKWREARPPPRYKNFGLHAPFVHGAVHLLPERFLPNYECFIVGFDIESEEYTEISLPKCFHNVVASPSIQTIYLTELGGSLCLNFQFEDRDEPKIVIELWLLKDYDCGEWVKEYTIDLNSLDCASLGEALAIMDVGSVLLRTACKKGEEIKCSLYCYNRQDQTYTWKIDLPIYNIAILFVESFLMLGSSGNHTDS